jgi:hypothetical protein
MLKVVEESSLQTFKGSLKISFEAVVSALITMVLPANLPTCSSPKCFGTGLRLLRGLIENENGSECLRPADEWDTEDWIESKHKIVRQQNLLTDMGAVESVCAILSDREMPGEIIEEACLLLITMLIGGNEHVQRRLHTIFTGQDGNLFLTRIEQMLSESFDSLRAIYDEVDKLLFKKSLNPESQGLHIEEMLAQKEDYAQTKRMFLLLMKILQLTCEGHNAQMQNLLREQHPVAGRSYNFIQFSCLKLRVFMRFFNKYSLEMGQKLLEFLIESIQGPCIANQVEGIKEKVVEGVREIFSSLSKKSDYESRDFNNEEEVGEANSLLSLGAKLLLSLTEGNLNHEVYLNIHENMNYNELKNSLLIEYRWLLHHLELQPSADLGTVMGELKDRYDILPDRLFEAFNIYLLLRYLHYEHERYQQDSEQPQRLDRYDELELIVCPPEGAEENLEKRALLFYRSLTRSIEVKLDDELKRVYFLQNPACFFISKETKDNFMTNVNRTSGSEKVNGLMQKVNEFCFEIKYLRRLHGMPVRITIERVKALENLNIFIAVLINLLAMADIFLTSRAQDDGTNRYGFATRWEQSGIFYTVLVALQILLYAVLLVGWLLISAPLEESRRWTSFNEGNKTFIQQDIEDTLQRIDSVAELSISEIIYALNIKGPEDHIWYTGETRSFGNNFGACYFWFKRVSFILSAPDFLLNLVWLSCSVAGLVAQYPSGTFFFAMQLLVVVRKDDIFRSVIQSITENSFSLLISYLVGTIIMYIFAMLLFIYLSGDSYLEASVTELMCDTMVHCVFNVHYFGLLYGGGISENLRMYSTTDPQHYYIRGLYDLLFFWIIQIIFLNLFFGIVIDTFAFLRNKRNDIHLDKTNRCFICHIDRVKFEKHSDGFEKHIELEHYAWDYVWYIFYLKEKDETEHTGIESTIFGLYSKNNESWFPVQRSINLERRLQGKLDEDD